MLRRGPGRPRKSSIVAGDNDNNNDENNITTTNNTQEILDKTDSLTNGTSPNNNPVEHDTQTNNDGPPSKRRRLEVSPSHRISPPWKKIAVDGPTSFVEDGRRKSSRTNSIPLELRPQTDKRQTRSSSNIQTPVAKSLYGGESRRSTIMPSNSPASQSPSMIKRTYTTRKHVSETVDAPPARYSTPRRPAAKTPVATTSSAKHKSTRSIDETLPSKPIKSPCHSMQTRKLHEKRTSARVNEKAGTTAKKEVKTTEDPSHLESSQPADTDVTLKTPRLKFRVNMPKLPIQHPSHVLAPRKFSSFQEWSSHDDPLAGDDTKRMTEDEARKEAQLRSRIVEASLPGGLLSEERCSLYMPEAQDEPDRQYAHQDHLIAQALHFRKLMNAERRQHAIAARRIAHAAAAEWKRRQPKTAEEVLQEQYEANLLLYKQVRKDLQAKWDVVIAEVNKRRQTRWEEEQQLLGKRALNNMLEHSTQLLDARRAGRSSEISSVQRSDNDDDDDDDDEEVQAGSSDEGESNMSSSQSTSEDGLADNKVDEDENLTVEQLREKYSTLSRDVSSLDPPSVPVEDQTQGRMRPKLLEADHDKEDGAEPEAEGTPLSMSLRRHHSPDVESAGQDASIIDESDESVDMDDDLGDSDEDQESEEDSSESEESSPGLLGFFGREALTDQLTPGDVAEAEAVQDTQVEGVKQETDGSGEATIVPESSKLDLPELDTTANLHTTNLDGPEVMEGLVRTADVYQSSADPSSQTSPGANTTGKPSEMDSASSIGLHADSQHPSSATTPQPTYHLKTPIPSLLRGTLREYQHYGLDWLAGLYANGTNGILADEMGLGKTIQTIALLAHLACHHEVWGPHLIIVPTSVMLNWEMEFKKFCPGFKILTYYGSQEERRQKRKGWLDDDKWNACITSYQLVLQDQQTFKRRNWHYMILDEAHNIKNFRSQRWQTLLTFKSTARLLLTGTPLQNNLTELWSLLFFLMPSESVEGGIGRFADLREFSDWFKRPVEQILENGRDTMDDEAKAIIGKLHKVLRPYLLRRLKADVEKQMPAKYEHVVYCRLSKRQRYLYDGFMSLAQTRETLKSGNHLSIINCLMQLRKVCNHPDLFETRPVVTSFAMPKSAVADYEIKELLVRKRLLQEDTSMTINLDFLNYVPAANEHTSHIAARESANLVAIRPLQELCKRQYARVDYRMGFDASSIDRVLTCLENASRISRLDELRHCVYLTALRSQKRPIYGTGLVDLLTIRTGLESVRQTPKRRAQLSEWYLNESDIIGNMLVSLAERSSMMKPSVEKFGCITPAVVATDMVPLALSSKGVSIIREAQRVYKEDAFHEPRIRLSIAFPDKRLLQYDCGKLQRLDKLLRELQAGGHRALIFTQMTKVLDILEQFLNIHGHRYLRLDGATKVEQRQVLTDRFNNDPRILAFILSSRSGGLGINLTGADTVIFYDLDWNPAMDKQCQDRCHRIGQTRDVHIYRFVSEYTIESNILRKANQKKMLDDVVIQEGDFTTDYFNKLSVRDMLGYDASVLDGDADANAAMDRVFGGSSGGGGTVEKVFEQVEDREDIMAAKIAEKELVQGDDVDFEDKRSTRSATPKTPAATVTTPKQIMRPRTGTPVTAIRASSLQPTNARRASVDGKGQSNLSTTNTTPLEQDTVVDNNNVKDTKMRSVGGGDIATTPATTAAVPVAEEQEQELEPEQEEPGHIDEYMLRFMERELEKVPLSMPSEKNKSKKGRGGAGGNRTRK